MPREVSMSKEHAWEWAWTVNHTHTNPLEVRGSVSPCKIWVFSELVLRPKKKSVSETYTNTDVKCNMPIWRLSVVKKFENFWQKSKQKVKVSPWPVSFLEKYLAFEKCFCSKPGFPLGFTTKSDANLNRVNPPKCRKRDLNFP